METFSLMLHVSAAAVLVGPQLLMFYAVTPSTWLIDDERLKRDVVRVVARRFGMLATGALVVLLATGLYQFYFHVPEFIRDDLMAYRFGQIFMWKMTMFTVLILLILVHMLVFARRISRLSDAVIEGHGDAGDLETARTQSLLVSLVLLIASFITLWLGVALGDPTFSYVAN
jgi:putative copper export protein